MSRRDYPVADLYEERERDFYRGGRRGTREYAEFDEDIRTSRTPDFLREGYGRSSTAGPVVVRGHAHGGDSRTEVDVDTRTTYARSARGSPPARRTREIEKEELIIREDRAPPPSRRDDEFTVRRSVPDLRRARGVEKEEIDVDIRRESDVRSVRSTRPREVEREEIDVDIRRASDARSVRSARPREVEEDISVDIRRNSDARSVRSARPREVEREDISIRKVESERAPPTTRSRGSEEEIIIRRGEGSRPPPRSRTTERTEVEIKEERSGPRSRRGGFEEEEIDIKETETRGPRSRRGPVEEETIDIRRESRGRAPSVGRERERITIREQSRGPPPSERILPPNLVRRETEEFVIRRRRPPSPSPSPPPPPRVEQQEIIIRRTERSPTPPPPLPEPEPEPEPVIEPIRRPPIYQEIHQEIITHHRHIDHGVERARSPSPPPPPPAPVEAPVEKTETLEIDIRKRDSHGAEDQEIEIRKTRTRERSQSPATTVVSRARSHSVPRSRYYDDGIEAEAEYYNHRALARGYPGEAYNGATRDWAVVDIPPGTERVRMDGAGGGAQEITWQRYNGSRRSKFITGDREYDTPFGEPAPIDDRRVGPTRPKPADMWTEVTKDLVVKEAIETMGYEYEETDEFFYVMEYLRYEDVLQLVEISDDIRSSRRRRIREIEWERSAIEHPPRDYYEREVIIDRRERRH